jgi:hypothetical protein
MPGFGGSQSPISKIRRSGGRPGEETYLAFRDSGLFNHDDRLYLQFRKGRLAGWKGGWGHNWMWQ